MQNYYVNKTAQANGDHEVHRGDCFWMPDATNRAYLGLFSECGAAIEEARAIYEQANGCFHCSPDCHTT